MLKKIVILVFILSTMVLLAMAPMSGTPTSGNIPKLQTTTEPPVVGVTIQVDITTSPDGSSPPAQGGLPLSTLIIFGLIAVLGVAIVIGGIALMSRR